MALQAEHKKQQKILAVVQAAEEIFFKKSYNSVTVDEVAQLAGVTKNTLYSYFPSKLSLFIRMFDHYLQELHRLFVEAIEREPRPDHALMGGIVVLYRFTWENEKFMRFFWALNPSEMNGEIPAELIHSVHLWNRGLIEQAIRLVRRGQAQGVINDALDAERMVHLVSAVNKGILIHTSKQAKWSIANVRPSDLMGGFLRLAFNAIFTDQATVTESSVAEQWEASAWKSLS
ncbi:MAG: TetR/AcrR family transcriptional regulator [Thermodesulfobacteriota bacterium]